MNSQQLAIQYHYRDKAKAKRVNARKLYLMKAYGITQEDYEQMLDAQSNQCAICGVYRAKLAIDHDHKTGKVRGLLCRKCNRGLGYFKDNAEGIQRALDYLTL